MPCPTTDMCLGIVSGVYRRTDSDDEATLQVFISIEGYNILFLPCIGDCIGPDELHRDSGELSVLLPGGVGTPGRCNGLLILQLKESEIKCIS